MIPILGAMIGFYAVARCIEMIYRNNSIFIRIFALIAIFIQVLGILILFVQGASIGSNLQWYLPR